MKKYNRFFQPLSVLATNSIFIKNKLSVSFRQ